jgi:hypothetical protein
MKKAYDRKHQEMTFRIGDWVMADNRHMDRDRPNEKLDHKYMRPFQIAGLASKQAYKLIIIPRYRNIHPTQHVSRLEPYQGPPVRDEHTDPVMVNGVPEFYVECILEAKR